MDKGKGIMTEEPRTQSRRNKSINLFLLNLIDYIYSASERTFMGDAIRAERTSQFRHQRSSQIQQSATQDGQLGSNKIYLIICKNNISKSYFYYI